MTDHQFVIGQFVCKFGCLVLVLVVAIADNSICYICSQQLTGKWGEKERKIGKCSKGAEEAFLKAAKTVFDLS